MGTGWFLNRNKAGLESSGSRTMVEDLEAALEQFLEIGRELGSLEVRKERKADRHLLQKMQQLRDSSGNRFSTVK